MWSIMPEFSWSSLSRSIRLKKFTSFVSTNLEGFIYITQLAVKQMLRQDTGGSVTSITASLARKPDCRRSCVYSNDDQRGT